MPPIHREENGQSEQWFRLGRVLSQPINSDKWLNFHFGAEIRKIYSDRNMFRERNLPTAYSRSARRHGNFLFDRQTCQTNS